MPNTEPQNPQLPAPRRRTTCPSCHASRPGTQNHYGTSRIAGHPHRRRRYYQCNNCGRNYSLTVTLET